MYNQDAVDKLCELVNIFDYRLEKIEKKVEKQTQENEYMFNRLKKEKAEFESRLRAAENGLKIELENKRLAERRFKAATEQIEAEIKSNIKDELNQ
jgi:hypothetical protein